MYLLSSEEVRAAAGDETRFATAVAKLPFPQTEPRVVQGSFAAADSAPVYLEFEAVGGQKARTSLALAPDGVKHPELQAQLGATAPAATAGGAGTAPTGTVAGPAGRVIDGETAESILETMEAATKKAQTFSAEVAMNGSLMGTSLNETGKLLYKSPDKVRLEFKSFLLNSDGARSIVYLSSANTYLDVGSLGGLELSPGLGTSASELRDKYDITLRGKSEVNGQPVFELHLRPPSSGGIGSLMGGLGGGGSMRMWVSAETWWPIRVKLDAITADYQNLQLNPAGITDDQFKFTPPAGATTLILGGILGSMEGAGAP